ncbi:MAG: hypothetical protein EU981_04555 [Candidatus Liberibacter ctenarytainae]|uniref:Uncharacterized protein n=1 Tax=Candidatus Liberibacter ctenarytainae TaxID=2020335 RepID=A0A937AJQ2_9HYPH|nr:hypothetical protein [Candidatus Liberibacter ctenarytainae]
MFKCVVGDNSGAIDWQATHSLKQVSGDCTWEVSESQRDLKWEWGKISGFRTSRFVMINLSTPVQDNTSTLHWRLGMWGQEEGYPPCVSRRSINFCGK